MVATSTFQSCQVLPRCQEGYLVSHFTTIHIPKGHDFDGKGHVISLFCKELMIAQVPTLMLRNYFFRSAASTINHGQIFGKLMLVVNYSPLTQTSLCRMEQVLESSTIDHPPLQMAGR